MWNSELNFTRQLTSEGQKHLHAHSSIPDSDEEDISMSLADNSDNVNRSNYNNSAEVLKNSSLYLSLQQEANMTPSAKKFKGKTNNSVPKPTSNDQEAKRRKSNPSSSSCSVQEKENSTTEGKIKPSNSHANRYAKTDSGPFHAILFFKKTELDKSPPPSLLMIIEVTRNIIKMGIRFNHITKISRFKWMVHFDNKSSANEVLDNSFLAKSKFEMYIPLWMFSRAIVIKGIPKDITLNEIIEADSNNPTLHPIDCIRLKRRISTENGFELVDSTLKMRVRNLRIPEAIFLWRAKINVELFIPNIWLCFNCGQIKHTAKFCQNPAICLTCNQPRHENDATCNNPPSCINYKSNHKSVDINCPERIKQKEIAKIITIDNIDYNTAMRKVTNNSSSVTISNNAPSLNAINFSPLLSPRLTFPLQFTT